MDRKTKEKLFFCDSVYTILIIFLEGNCRQYIWKATICNYTEVLYPNKLADKHRSADGLLQARWLVDTRGDYLVC